MNLLVAPDEVPTVDRRHDDRQPLLAAGT